MNYNKFITFSYDDGANQDIRLVELLNKYNMKATFNINSELLGNKGEIKGKNGVTVGHDKVFKEDLKSVYEGHEVAVHTLTHPLLTELPEKEVIRQIEQDRINLEKLNKSEIVGMAYPCGHPNFNEAVAKIVEESTEIKYARTIVTTNSFSPQENLYMFNPTAFHLDFENLYFLADKFFEIEPEEKSVFYIWGHSYEFDFENTWDKFEEFLKYIANKKDIGYVTNKEVLL